MNVKYLRYIPREEKDKKLQTLYIWKTINSMYITKYNIFILKWFKNSYKRYSTFLEKLSFSVENMKPMKPKFCGSWKVSGYNKKVNEGRQLKLCHIKQGVRNSDKSCRCRVASPGMKHHINDMEILKRSSRARSCLW